VIPDSLLLKNSPADFALLVSRIGLPFPAIARRCGISRRRLEYLQVGERVQGDVVTKLLMTYPEQFILEALANERR
jgi:hypothetical protein